MEVAVKLKPDKGTKALYNEDDEKVTAKRKRRKASNSRRRSWKGLAVCLALGLVLIVIGVRMMFFPKIDYKPSPEYLSYVNNKKLSPQQEKQQQLDSHQNQLETMAKVLEKDEDDNNNNNNNNIINNNNNGATIKFNENSPNDVPQVKTQDNNNNNNNDITDTPTIITTKTHNNNNNNNNNDDDDDNDDEEEEEEEEEEREREGTKGVRAKGRRKKEEEAKIKPFGWRNIYYPTDHSTKPVSYSPSSFRVLFFLDDSPDLSSGSSIISNNNEENRAPGTRGPKPLVEELIKEELRDTRFFYFYQMYRKFTQVFTPQEVQAFVWGTDFSDYDPRLTLPENINRKFPENTLDFVLTSSPFWSSALSSVNGTNRVPLAVMYEDCFIKERLPTQDTETVFVCSHEGTGDLFFHSYANSMAYYVKYGYGSLLWHLPHAVDPTYFAPLKQMNERKTDILIVGNDWTFYPLRFKLLRMLDDGKLPGVVRRYINYPTATLVSGGTTPELRYAGIEAAYKELVAALKDAKIVVVCSGKRGTANRLYVEAAAAGALVVGDIPEEREEEFRSWMVELTSTSSEASLYHTLKWWLDNEDARSERAAVGMKRVIKTYGLKRTSMEVVFAMQSYVFGQRGAVFRHRFDEVDHFLPKSIICAKSLVQIDKLQGLEKKK